MAHVFISYARKDGDFAEVLISKLREENITHWFDSEHLRAGEDWRHTIDDAIRDSFALILIISPAAKTSEYVTYEWAFAWGLGIKVIPLVYIKTDLHPRLEALQYLDFTNRNQRPWGKLSEELKLLQDGYTPPPKAKIQIDAGTSKLIDDLSSADSKKRRKAIGALGNIGEGSAVAKLLEILQSDESWGARRDAIASLVKIGDDAAVRSLIRCLHQDTSNNVRADAAWALGEFKSKEAVASLIEIIEKLGQQDQEVKMSAVVALRKIDDRSVATRLLKVLHYSPIAVAARIIDALGHFGEAAAVKEIGQYLDNSKSVYINGETQTVSQVAAEALERIDTPEAIDLLNQWRSLYG
jgi:hypothetical protein